MDVDFGINAPILILSTPASKLSIIAYKNALGSAVSSGSNITTIADLLVSAAVPVYM